MQDYYPKEIFVDQSVIDLPHTRRIIAKFPKLPVHVVTDRSDIKFPQAHSTAKKQLYLARHKGQAVKSCQGMGDYVCCQYYTMALVSDCHLECTYCILQDYLKNNPVITMYTNVEEIFAEIAQRIEAQPGRLFRIGTGELSDSLALDHIHEYSKILVDFARSYPNLLLELKTKTDNVANLLGLDHRGRTIVSWSVNPQKTIDREEHKCSSLSERLDAARRCANAGYPVAFHFDPLLHFCDWQNEYANVVDQIAALFTRRDIAWVSIGSLRFTPDLKKIVNDRFPKSQVMAGELYPSQDGKTRYFRPLREEMYQFLSGEIRNKLKHVPYYLCMETKTVWQNIYNQVPENNQVLEDHLVQNFAVKSIDSNPPELIVKHAL